MTQPLLLQELVDQLRLAIGTALDQPVNDSKPASAAAGVVWSAHVSLRGMPAVTITFDDGGAGALTKALSGSVEVDDEAIRKVLSDLCTKAVSAAADVLGLGSGDTPVIEAPQLVELAGAPAESRAIRLESEALAAPVVVTVATDGADLHDVSAAEDDVDTERPLPNPAERIDVLLDIDLPLVVRFGATEMPLKQLSKIGPGSVIDLSRAPSEPVEMLVSDRLVARGEVVVVAGCYGIRVTELVGSRVGV